MNQQFMNKTPNPNSIYFSPTWNNEIVQIINKIKKRKTDGQDEINSDFIKQINTNITTPLAIIMNNFIETGKVPTEMKLAEIISIYKAKDKTLFNNFRPVSLLPCFSKILEKLIQERVYYFLLQNNIFDESQYGFRRNQSTANAVMDFCHDFINAFENKESSMEMFLDISKAFNTIMIY